MAKLYGEIAAKALLTLDKSFARANGQPLDASEVYYSKAAAEEYAAGAQAYVGQKIVVVENNVVTHYSIEDTAGTLKELGSKPVGDNHSITVGEDGKVSMKDFGTGYYKYIPLEKNEDGSNKEGTGVYESELTEGFAENLTLKVKLAAGGGYEIAWYAPNTDTTEGVLDTVTGLSQSVETLNNDVDKVESDVTDLQESIYGEGGTPEAPAEGSIAANVNDLVDTVGKEDDVLGDNVDTLWANVNSQDGRIATIEADYLKAADKEELQGKIDAIVIPVTGVAEGDKVLDLTDKLLSATVTMGYDDEAKAIKLYGKNNVELGSVDATPFIKDGMLHDVDYNAENNTLTFTWNTDAGEAKTDTVVLSDIIEPYIAGDGLELTGNEFKVKLADGSESFLTVSADGLKLSGITDAISAAEERVVAAAAEDAQERADAAKQAAIDDAATKYATTGALEQLSTDVDGRLDALEAHDHTTYATKTEINEYKTEVSNTYATQTTVNEISTVANNAAQKVETLEDKIDEITSVGGEPNVIEYIQVNGVAQEIIKDEEGNSTKTVNITVPTKVSDLTDDTGFDARITAAQAQADKGVNDAAAALAAAQQAQTEVDALEGEVGNLETTVAGHTEAIGLHGSRLDALEATDKTHADEYAALKGVVDGHTDSIADLVNNKADASALEEANRAIAANEAAIKALTETTVSTLEEEIGKKANAADVYTKAEIGELAEGKTLVDMIADAQAAATYDDTQIKADIQANTDAIAILNGTAEQTGSVLNIAQAEAASAAKAEVAAVVGAAPDAFNTLEEIALWISNDETGAAAMANRVTANENAIAAITNADTGILATANAYTDTAIAAIFENNKATNTAYGVVKGSADGVNIEAGEIKSVSTDLLVNGSQALVLYGGNSGATV